jgi:inhibitor of Bruton tyrosine kinase
VNGCDVWTDILTSVVNTRNVCRILNAVADCSVNEFKQAALEYICLNLETMLEQRFVANPILEEIVLTVVQAT